MEVMLKALVKEVKTKALASLDKGLEIKLQSNIIPGDEDILKGLSGVPSDGEVTVILKW